MAGPRALLVLAAVLAAAIAATATAAEEYSTSGVLTPVADSPVGSFDGEAAAGNAIAEAKDAAPVGAPIGTTMTEPQPELTTPPGAAGSASSRGSFTGVAPVAVATGLFAL